MNIDSSLPNKMRNAIGMNARQMAALLVTGHRLYEQGRWKDAKNIFEGLAVLDSSNPYVQGILGSIYQKQQQYDLALVHYNNAIALYPQDVNALTNRGEVLVLLGRFQDAAKDFKGAIQLDPEKNDPAANRARLLVLLVQDAIGVTRESSLIGPQEARKQST